MNQTIVNLESKLDEITKQQQAAEMIANQYKMDTEMRQGNNECKKEDDHIKDSSMANNNEKK